jgi:hypothetical protein
MNTCQVLFLFFFEHAFKPSINRPDRLDITFICLYIHNAGMIYSSRRAGVHINVLTNPGFPRLGEK